MQRHPVNFFRHGRTLSESDFQLGFGNLFHGGVMRANALMDRQEACNEILLGVLLDLLEPFIFEEFVLAAPYRIAKIRHPGSVLTAIECKYLIKFKLYFIKTF